MKYFVGYVKHNWNGKGNVFTVREVTEDKVKARKLCNEFQKRSYKMAQNTGNNPADYEVLSETQLAEQRKKEQGKVMDNRRRGALKALETRKKDLEWRKKEGLDTTPNYICCPKCGAKSKKLYSEMGGLQTRRCKNGHYFEFDKWISDRAIWNPVAAIMTERKMVDRPYHGDPDREG